MRLRILIAGVLALYVVIATTSRAATAVAPPQITSLAGRWATALTVCEVWPGGPFARREAIFTAREFSMRVTQFANATCTIPTVRTRTEGTYRITGPSSVVLGAVEVELRAATVSVTPLTLTAADLLNAAPIKCGTDAWITGTDQALVPARGCPSLGIGPIASRTEFDIARIDGNGLFLGLRPADGQPPNTPDRRPTLYGPVLNLIQTEPQGGAQGGILLPDAGGDLTQPRSRK